MSNPLRTSLYGLSQGGSKFTLHHTLIFYKTMKYLYPSELKHQIFDFARSYRWREKTSKRVFSEDFIVSQLSVDRRRIPQGTLQKVMEVASEIVPSDRFRLQ